MYSLRRTRIATVLGAMLLIPLLAAMPATAEDSDTHVEQIPVTVSDGVQIMTTLTGAAPIEARPTIVEFSPYGRGSETFRADANYNHLLVQIRGTGDSHGSFDALGPRSQADVVDVLGWACQQPWSNGRLGITGFSASAIIIYNSMHVELPCVETAHLRSGTFELYRDLLVPGGVSNIVPGIGVIAMIGAPALLQAPERLQTAPITGIDTLTGLIFSGLSAGFLHPTLDDFWVERGFRGNANNIPVLVTNDIFDVESRGVFQGYQELRDDGARLWLVGGHSGHPAGTDGGQAAIHAWFDHYLRDIDNGITDEPRVQIQMADGNRQDFLDGQYIQRNDTDWPIPGTTWASLNLDATRANSAATLNDGSLTLGDPQEAATQTYLPIPTNPLATDVPTTALLGVPFLNDMSVAGLPGLSYTTPVLSEDVMAVGPASLEISLSTTSPETTIWAVISDVHPDGSVHPLTVGRLQSTFPNVIEEKSLIDEDGNIVQPYGDYSTKTLLAGFLTPQHYHVELWPIANRFKEGHRIRLDIVGASLFSLPSVPGVNSVDVGGDSGSRLLFPVLPESDLEAALASPVETTAPPAASVTTEVGKVLGLIGRLLRILG